ncbi:hypothetical protein DERF_012422 [Dermatophagoides farinae]|uniref:Uncharacterized protein n=1 Tax=Dermatophagoides farinae TaxID=6954 RepID=A0A922L057_DERFA|nr:hypothetical protein DERF_012422 [Dermatophagoides farinae]
MEKQTNHNQQKDIPILNFSNYNQWRTLMMTRLMEKGLDKVVWGNENDPSLPSEMNAEALLFIYKHLDHTLRRRFRNERNAKHLWTELTGYFERSKSTFITFIRLKCQMGKSRDYCTQFFTMIEHLRMYGIQFDENVIQELFLSKLPAEFDSLIHSIRYDTQHRAYTLEELKSLIFYYESLFEQQNAKQHCQHHQQQQQQQQQQHPMNNFWIPNRFSQPFFHPQFTFIPQNFANPYTNQQQQQYPMNNFWIPNGFSQPFFHPQFTFIPQNFANPYTNQQQHQTNYIPISKR